MTGTIFGVHHIGKENGYATVAELKKMNLDKRSVVAVEFSEALLASMTAELKKNSVKNIVARIDKRIAKLNAKTDAEKKVQLRQNQFSIILCDYLLATHAQLALLDPLSVKTRSNQKERIQNFILIPIRERKWQERFGHLTPNVVLVGSGHVAGVKKIWPNMKTKNLGTGLERVIGYASKGYAAILRKQYAAYKKMKHIKRTMKNASVKPKVLPK